MRHFILPQAFRGPSLPPWVFGTDGRVNRGDTARTTSTHKLEYADP